MIKLKKMTWMNLYKFDYILKIFQINFSFDDTNLLSYSLNKPKKIIKEFNPTIFVLIKNILPFS